MRQFYKKKAVLPLLCLILASLALLSSCAQPTDDGLPSEPDQLPEDQLETTCTISISCEVLLSNGDLLDEEKLELVPEDGFLLAETQVSFEDGQSVFDILQQVTRDNEIHFEFSNTPVYNSAYIEGIGNIYEFDAGPLSGWMYSVNDSFPNYGSSAYGVTEGDVIKLLYTVDLGEDIGGADAFGQQD